MPASVRPTAPATAPARRRLPRVVWIVGIAFGALAVVGLAAFTWIGYWPLEGREPRVEALVPADVDFLYRASWKEMREAGWVARNIVDAPVHPDVDLRRIVVDDRRTTVRDALAQVQDIEEQIEASLPGPVRWLQSLLFGANDVDLGRDLLAGEVVVAGRWCPGGDPARELPTARDVLLLTRVTPQVRFAVAALRHDFVRKQAIPPDLVAEALPDGLLRIEIPSMRVPRRLECEGGVLRSPLNAWWLGRSRDVVVLSNSEDLAAGALAVASGHAERAIDRPGFDVERPEGGLSAAIDLPGLRSYLTRLLAPPGGATALSSVMARFLALEPLDRIEATVSLPPAGLGVRAEVAYSPVRLRNFPDVAQAYDQLPTSPGAGIARLVPARDTAFVAHIRSDARPLLAALWESISKEDRKIVERNLRTISRERRAAGKPAYDDVQTFLDELAAQLGTETGIAVARMSAVFNEQQFQTWYGFDDPVPSATLAVLLSIRAGVRQEDVDEFLADRVGAMGFRPPEPVTKEGITYSRLRFRPQKREGGATTEELPPDLRNYEPAFKVHDNRLIVCNREDYLLEILKVMRGGTDAPKSVASSSAFREAFGALPEVATLALWVDADEARGLAWDFRNTAVRRAHPDEKHAAEFRARRIADLTRAGGDFSKIRAQADADVDAEMTRFRTEGYRTFLREYRDGLDATRRIAGLGFVLTARRADERLDLGVRVLFAAP